MTEEHINEIKAILILAISMIIFASLISFVPEDLPWFTSSPNVPTHNFIRITGAYLAGCLFFVFGQSAYFLSLFLAFWSWNKFTARELRFTWIRLLSCLILFFVVSSFFSMTGIREDAAAFRRGGLIGMVTVDFLVQYLGVMGATIVLLTLGALSLILTGEFLVTPIVYKGVECVQWIWDRVLKRQGKVTKANSARKIKPKIVSGGKGRIPFWKKIWPWTRKGKDTIVESDDEEDEESEIEETAEDEEDEEDEEQRTENRSLRSGKPKIKISDTPKSKSAPVKSLKVVGEYHLPPLDLLDDSPEVSTAKIESDLMDGAKMLEGTLADFGVSAHVAHIERGPAITRYELEPAPGVKVQKFTALADDIALAMRAAAVRIVAPIPGKNRVGIEVPNPQSASVYLKDVLSMKEFQGSKSKLTIALGKDIGGKPMVADLSEMPHLLIAGTTGSGKSVCVNGIIMSILFNATPGEVKFVMIDPKMVEMAQYNAIPHLLSPTLTDPKKASAVLNWLVSEMEHRYRKLAKEGVRNIKQYNTQGRHMPYIVLVVDELADLMQVSAKTVESSIMRIAQLSRAVGIHMILATQRPSVDVITGVIKANFPARISFKVASKTDSRTVLDMNGAEALLGKGDMLFIQPGDMKPTRGQCSFVKDAEIARVIDMIKQQQEPEYDETITNPAQGGVMGEFGEKDEYYDEAVKLVMETNQASVSILQRRLRLGYTRAARLIDMMEQNGLVGPYCGSKARDILVDREQWLLDNMSEAQEDKDE